MSNETRIGACLTCSVSVWTYLYCLLQPPSETLHHLLRFFHSGLSRPFLAPSLSSCPYPNLYPDAFPGQSHDPDLDACHDPDPCPDDPGHVCDPDPDPDLDLDPDPVSDPDFGLGHALWTWSVDVEVLISFPAIENI